MQTKNEERWGIVASAPPINPAEVESAEEAVEVVVMWGQNVLHVEHVSPPREVILEEMLGQDAGAKHPVVVERDGQLCCVLPSDAEGTVTVGEATRSLEELKSEGKLLPFDGLHDAHLYPLPEGAVAELRHSGLTFLVRPTHAGKSPPTKAQVSWRRYGWIGLSLGVHGLFLVMFYFMPPSTQALSLDTITATDRMIEFLDPAAAQEEEEEIDFMQPSESEAAGDPGEAHTGEEGDSGRDDAPQTNRRFAIEGREDDPNPEMARERLRNDMEHVAAIGAVAAFVGSWDTPTSPFGAESAHGRDPLNAIGELMGSDYGDSAGAFGLGMRGTGRGAGGTGLGTYGVGEFGTIGSCRGSRCGHGPGTGEYGTGVGTLRRRRPGPTVRPIQQVAQVRGGLSRDAIRRVVQRNLSQVRHCYEQGLQQNPSIEGRVTVSWIVGPTGAVAASSVANSTLSNQRVEQCITQAVRRWNFPQPDGGSPVGVNYPFMLQSPN